MISAVTLPILLKRLNLLTMQLTWEEVAQQAEQAHWPYPQYLAVLCSNEVARRDQRRIQQILKEAKLPLGKGLDTFDFSKTPSINAVQISALAENTEWVQQANNLIIFGPSGVGKTHLAAAIGRRLAEHDVRVFFAKTTTLVQKLQAAYREHKLGETLAKLAKFDLLILDDIGYVKKSDAETSVLFELISDRYESKSLLITSNQAFDQWDTIFPNNIMAVAAIDRLVHHSTIIRFC